MQAREIRKKFTEFFEKDGHLKIESSSLIPQNDPTLLFANAGMNQFKDYFTGAEVPSNKRATTIQKCVRAGGKHNDLENVGFTARHHTFFEMLGNFSFGDYFKNKAIDYAWKFLTEELKISKDKLYVTVHKSDQQAADIWHKEQGVPKDRIFFLGDKDNFWEMGDVGPCGPSSEIFYDHGEEFSDGADTSECILADEGRYVEIWNLVFMQYEKFKEDGQIKRRELPSPSVDTGAGLERIAALLQGKYWNYDSDIFTPIISSLEKLSGQSYTDNEYTSNFRVIIDHIRSSVMLITDGVIPSNDGRGYVLRRIIRRAIRHLEEIGLNDISFYKLIPSVFETLGQEYPQNKSNTSLAEKFLKLEEEKFRQTLKNGLDLINKEISSLKGNKLKGEIAFKLYDTYGFPLDLTQTILEEKSINLDIEKFEKLMKAQKEQSKKKGSFAANENDLSQFFKIKETHGETNFIGYEKLESTEELIDMTEMDNTKTALFFKNTPFYSESGGQSGDKGYLLKNDEVIGNIIDTQYIVEGLSAHIVVNLKERISLKQNYTLRVDHQKRNETAKHHSATHLLQSSLIEVLGDHVKQAGSAVNFDRLRFDFTHPESISEPDLIKVEALVNQKIQEALPVSISFMTKDEATKKGAMALFGEKYSSEVRVLKMGDFSLELCGGTHVTNTSDIGIFKITSESSLSSGVRRIEAIVSKAATEYLLSRSKVVSKLEKEFSVKSEKILNKVESLLEDLKIKNKKIKTLEDQIQSAQIKNLFTDPIKVKNDLQLFVVKVSNTPAKEFRALSDKFLDAYPNDIAFIYSTDNNSLSYLLRTNKKNDINCSTILKENQNLVDGRGGGKPDMAQGSGKVKNADQFIEAIQKALL